MANATLKTIFMLIDINSKHYELKVVNGILLDYPVQARDYLIDIEHRFVNLDILIEKIKDLPASEKEEQRNAIKNINSKVERFSIVGRKADVVKGTYSETEIIRVYEIMRCSYLGNIG